MSPAYLEKIVSTTGAASSGTTISSNYWTGCIATFRAAHAISLNPTSGKVGDTVTITAAGMLGSHSGCTANLGGTPVTLSATTTDANGALTATFAVPASISGSKTFTLTDGTNSPTASFTVNSKITLTPTSGLVGSSVSVTATGMVASHAVTATFGGSPVTLTPSSTGTTGSLTATFTVPVSTLGAKTVMVSDGTNNPSATYTVNPSALHHFVISVPTSATSGTSFGGVSVTAYDVNNNVKIDYVGLVYFQSSDAGATLPYTSTSKYTFQAGDNGAHTFSGFTLVHGPSQTLTVTDGSISVTSSAITVDASAFDHFVVTAPGSVSAGTAFSLTVTAKDASGNTVTSYSGSVGLTASSGSVSPISTGTSGWVSGVWTSSSVTLTTVGSITITANDGSGHTGVSGSITVSPGALDHFVFASIDSPQYAGMGFSITVTAFDANNNVKTDWTGSVSLTASNGGSVLPSSLNIASGGAVTGAVSVSKTGTGVTLGASAGGKSGTSGSFNVNPGALDHFGFSSVSSPQTAGTAFSLTVTAYDAYNNVKTDWTGFVSLTESNGGSVSPSPLTISSGGQVTSMVTVSLAGTGVTLGASGGGKTATSNSFTVNAAPTVTIAPTSAILDVGQSKLFTATPAGGSGSYVSYQWYVGGVLQSGESASTFNYAPTSAGTPLITATVTDSLGATSVPSNAASVTVNGALSVSISSYWPSYF